MQRTTHKGRTQGARLALAYTRGQTSSEGEVFIHSKIVLILQPSPQVRLEVVKRIILRSVAQELASGREIKPLEAVVRDAVDDGKPHVSSEQYSLPSIVVA